MKILNVNDLLEASACLDDEQIGYHSGQLTLAAEELARAIAQKLGIQCVDVSDQGSAFGGLCATFRPAFEGQPCPQEIDGLDSGGEWE